MRERDLDIYGCKYPKYLVLYLLYLLHLHTENLNTHYISAYICIMLEISSLKQNFIMIQTYAKPRTNYLVRCWCCSKNETRWKTAPVEWISVMAWCKSNAITQWAKQNKEAKEYIALKRHNWSWLSIGTTLGFIGKL